jgi:hypothetical protein
MSDIGNAFNLILFVVLAVFILFLIYRTLTHNPARPNPRNRRWGGGDAPPDDTPRGPTTSETQTAPHVSEKIRADGRQGNTTRAPWAAPMPTVTPPTREQWQRGEAEWLRLGREMDAPGVDTPKPEPAPIPAPNWPVKVK